MTVENARGDPGDLIAQKLPSWKREILPYMVQVRRAVKLPPFPAGLFGLDSLGVYRPFPELDDLLVGPHLVRERQTSWEGTNEPAFFGFEYGEETFNYERCHEDVVVQKEYRLGLCAPQEKVALLGDTAWLMVVPLD